MQLSLLCFLASLAFLVLANLKNVKKAKVSKDGFEIEARQLIEKAEVTIAEMQKLAKLVAKTALSLVKRSNRIGGYSVEEQEGIKESTLHLLNELNITEEDQINILNEYNKFIEIDYVFLLLGNQVPTSWTKEEQKKRKDMLDNIVTNYPSPEKIETLLQTNNSLTDKHIEIIEDYKYFRANKKYRRPEAISKYEKLRNELKLITK